MSLGAWTLNTAWMLSCQREAAAWQRATRNVASAQAELLRAIVAAQRDTSYGRLHGFDAIHTPADYQARVPMVQYADLAPWIDRIAAGESQVLTGDPIERLVPTSGTTSAEKLIPYTAALRRQFQRGIAAWIGNLYRHRPAVRRGRAYWSISPAFGPARTTSGGLPIGFPDDTAYLGPLERIAMRRLLAVPGDVAQLADISAVRYATLLHLLAAEDLALISVWNPSFLTLLLAPLRTWGERLCRDLERGTSFPRVRNARRARQCADLLRSTTTDAELLSALWPQLALISCWTDASAHHRLAALRQLFPQVEIQPKGLLATEGIVSLPQCDHAGAALALRSHFFEFAAADDPTRVHLAHELETGGRYRVLLTTGGGLYRYHLNDEVEVVGRLNACPLVRFLGKADRTCDLVGEKLAEQQVQAALASVCQSIDVQPTFALVVPLIEPAPGYRLYVQGVSPAQLARLASDLDEALAANPYYRHALQHSQLAPLEARLLPAELDGAAIYEARCLARGQRAGDIKPAVLDSWTGWPALLEPARQTLSADRAR